MQESIRVALPRVRADLIARPRLQAWLADAVAHRKLLLLIAPAGYGKTVALIQALRKLPDDHAVAWVSCSEEDELQHLLTALLDALDPFDLPWRISPDALPALALREGGLKAVVDELAHGLAQAEVPHGVMAFDDVHRIADPVVFEFMKLLLAALPEKWALAMTSRVDPPLQLARMRLAGEVLEVRQEELRFQREDVEALLQAMKLPEGTGQVDQLLQRTQGWVAGLNLELMAEATQPHGAHVQKRRFDYLAQEVLGQLPVPMQEFLLRCSCLQVLNASRCEHVSGDSRAAHWLDELERRDLFVTVLDDDQLTLRLHDLFREFLERKLSLDHPDEVARLLMLAAETEPDVVLKVGYLLKAGAAYEAARLLLETAASMVHSGRGEELIRLVERLPEPMRSKSPEVAFMRGLFAGQQAEWVTMLASAKQALAGFERDQQWAWGMQARGLASLALFYLGRRSEGLAHWAAATRVEADSASQITAAYMVYWRALDDPDEWAPDELWRLVRLLSTEAAADHWAYHFHVYFMMVGRPGMREPLAALVHAVLTHASESRPQLRLAATRLQAWLTLWKGDFDEAKALCDEVITEAQWLGNPPVTVSYNQLLIAIERSLSGDYAQARTILQGIIGALRRNAHRRVHVFAGELAGLATSAEDWPVARELLSVYDSPSEAPDWPIVKLQSAMLRAELALHERNHAKAIETLLPLAAHAQGWDRCGAYARYCVTLARARLRAGEVELAWAAVRPAVQQAMEAGEPVGLLLCGATALHELASAPWLNTTDTSVLAYLRACASRAMGPGSSPAVSAARVPQPAAPHGDLSDREMQVVELVMQGQSNKVIARALNISPHTVKRHMARILDKTGQSSRGGIAAWQVKAIGSRPM